MGEEALAIRGEGRAALREALRLWAEATTDPASARRADLLRDKQKAVADFFELIGKSPVEVTPLDVEAWRWGLERRRPRLAPATIYYRMARLASFFSWAMRHTAHGRVLGCQPGPPRPSQGPEEVPDRGGQVLDRRAGHRTPRFAAPEGRIRES